jgi:hypothetical protein
MVTTDIDTVVPDHHGLIYTLLLTYILNHAVRMVPNMLPQYHNRLIIT